MNRKIGKWLFAALMLCALPPLHAQDNVIDEVAWVVGDEAILKSEIEEARLSALYENRRFDGDPYCVIPEEIAVNKLFLHQAELDSIEVSESEVIQRVDAQTNMFITNLGSREKMEEYFNKTSTQIREMLREVSEIESIGDSCYNLARTLNHKHSGKTDFTEKQYEKTEKWDTVQGD